jgi:dolichol-phosphate mannosyltransferase
VLFPETQPEIHQLVGIFPAMLINYFLNSYWTFKNAPEFKD